MPKIRATFIIGLSSYNSGTQEV